MEEKSAWKEFIISAYTVTGSVPDSSHWLTAIKRWKKATGKGLMEAEAQLLESTSQRRPKDPDLALFGMGFNFGGPQTLKEFFNENGMKTFFNHSRESASTDFQTNDL